MDAFDRQVNRLVHLGYPEAAGLEDAEFIRSVHPLKREVRGDNFLIVISEAVVPLAKQATLVDFRGNKGYAQLPLDLLLRMSDFNAPPFYLVYGVDSGNGTRKIPPVDCLEMFQKFGRLPLMAREGLALAVQNPGILTEAYLHFLGSCCGREYIASLWLSDSRPRFDRSLVNGAYPDWLSPFCIGRSYQMPDVKTAVKSDHCGGMEVGVLGAGC